MAVIYFGNGQTPVHKTGYSDGALTAVSFWDATATMKPVLTDYAISTNLAGTVNIIFGRAASSAVIFRHLMAGSATIVRTLDTPFVGDQNGGSFYVQTAVTTHIAVNLGGFEY